MTDPSTNTERNRLKSNRRASPLGRYAESGFTARRARVRSPTGAPVPTLTPDLSVRHAHQSNARLSMSTATSKAAVTTSRFSSTTAVSADG